MCATSGKVWIPPSYIPRDAGCRRMSKFWRWTGARLRGWGWLAFCRWRCGAIFTLFSIIIIIGIISIEILLEEMQNIYKRNHAIVR